MDEGIRGPAGRDVVLDALLIGIPMQVERLVRRPLLAHAIAEEMRVTVPVLAQTHPFRHVVIPGEIVRFGEGRQRIEIDRGGVAQIMLKRPKPLSAGD